MRPGEREDGPKSRLGAGEEKHDRALLDARKWHKEYLRRVIEVLGLSIKDENTKEE